MKERGVALVSTTDRASVEVTILLSVWILKDPLTGCLALGGSLMLAGLAVLVWM